MQNAIQFEADYRVTDMLEARVEPRGARRQFARAANGAVLSGRARARGRRNRGAATRGGGIVTDRADQTEAEIGEAIRDKAAQGIPLYQRAELLDDLIQPAKEVERKIVAALVNARVLATDPNAGEQEQLWLVGDLLDALVTARIVTSNARNLLDRLKPEAAPQA